MRRNIPPPVYDTRQVRQADRAVRHSINSSTLNSVVDIITNASTNVSVNAPINAPVIAPTSPIVDTPAFTPTDPIAISSTSETSPSIDTSASTQALPSTSQNIFVQPKDEPQPIYDSNLDSSVYETEEDSSDDCILLDYRPGDRIPIPTLS